MLTILTPAPTQDLTAIETVKSELQLTDSADDAVLGDLIRQASWTVSSHCRRVFAQETVRETYDRFFAIPCRRPILLTRTPVVQVISVTEDDHVLNPSDYAADRETGELHRMWGGYPVDWWPCRLTIDYIGGYSLLAELPHDVERCCIDLVKRYYYARSRDPSLRSEQILDVINSSYFGSSANGGAVAGAGFPSDGLPSDIAGRLLPYRNL